MTKRLGLAAGITMVLAGGWARADAGHLLTCHATSTPNAAVSWVVEVDEDRAGTIVAQLGTVLFWHHAPAGVPDGGERFRVTQEQHEGDTVYAGGAFSITVHNPQPLGGGSVLYEVAAMQIAGTVYMPDRVTCSNDTRL
jgi:hypothetical protein